MSAAWTKPSTSAHFAQRVNDYAFMRQSLNLNRMFALSTAWVPGENHALADIIVLGKKAGFSSFELGVTSAKFKTSELKSIVESNGVSIVSVHNICTDKALGEENVRGDQLSSIDGKIRKNTVRMTLETIRIAESLKASAVILHLGNIEMRHAKRKHFGFCKYAAQLGITRELVREVNRYLALRKKAAAPYIEAVYESIREILDGSKGSAVDIAVENRYFFNEIPFPEELHAIFQAFSDPRLKYWHDMGHANMFAYLRIFKEEDWLEKFAGRLAGIHVHDALKSRDHMPPGKGSDIDFSKYVKYFKDDKILKVVEIAAGWPAEDLKSSKEFLENLMVTGNE